MVPLEPADLLGHLGDPPTRGVQRWLYLGVRELIRSGRLPADQQLPSSRRLAAALDVARGTVATPLDLLRSEGFVVSAPRSGLRVAAVAGGPVRAQSRPQPMAPASPGTPDPGLFPVAAWSGSMRAALAAVTSADLGYPDPQGLLALREALAGRLRRTRGAEVDAESIIIVGGVAQALSLVATVLRNQGRRRIGLEDPGAPGSYQLIRANRCMPVPVPVDDGGMTVPTQSDLAAAIVTPTHHFPLGMAMSPSRRRRLLRWARDHDAVIIEDDYDAELRYDRRAAPALQALDPDRVILAGSVSKTLSPALRLGWMVVPDQLRGAIIDAKHNAGLGSSVLDQLAFERLLSGGRYQRHLRAAIEHYRHRRAMVIETVQTAASGTTAHLELGIAAGLHIVVHLDSPAAEERVVRELTTGTIAAMPLSLCCHQQPQFGVVLGTARRWPELADRLRAGLLPG